MRAKGIYINLATKDLEKSKEFYKGIGLEFISEYSDDTNISFKASENIFIMLMNPDKFIGFTNTGLTDSKKDNEVILSFEVGSIEEVEDIASKVLSFGGTTLGEPVDHGFMYYRSFKDIDGHQIEVFVFK